MKTIKQIFAKSILGIAVVALFLFTASCSQESDVTAVEALTVVEAKGGNDATRPVRITLEGTDNPDGPGGTFTGKMTHLGTIFGTVAPSDFTFITDSEGNPIGFHILTTAGDTDVIYAANGDELWSLSDISFFGPISDTEFGPFTYMGTITFVGGTGRFEGAEGFMDIDNGEYFIIGLKNDGETLLGAFSHVGNGEITY